MSNLEDHIASLNNKIVVILSSSEDKFFMVEFELAATKLGAKVLILNMDNSSKKKGESLGDTILNLGAMGADMIIINEYDFKENIDKLNKNTKLINVYGIDVNSTYSVERIEKHMNLLRAYA